MADVNSTATQNQTQQQADDAFFHLPEPPLQTYHTCLLQEMAEK